MRFCSSDSEQRLRTTISGLAYSLERSLDRLVPASFKSDTETPPSYTTLFFSVTKPRQNEVGRQRPMGSAFILFALMLIDEIVVVFVEYEYFILFASILILIVVWRHFINTNINTRRDFEILIVFERRKLGNLKLGRELRPLLLRLLGGFRVCLFVCCWGGGGYVVSCTST